MCVEAYTTCSEPEHVVVLIVIVVMIIGVVLGEVVLSRLPHTHWLSRLLSPKGQHNGANSDWPDDMGCGNGDGD